jgi:lysophospholipid acyltransferase
VRDIPSPPTSLPKRVYDIVGTIATLLLLNFIAAPFLVLYWRDTMEVWSRMDWYGIWMVSLGYAFFYGGGAKLCKNLKEKRLLKAETSVVSVEEEYVHPTLRTKDMEGIGMNAIPPVDEAITEFEEVVEKVIEMHKQETRKKQ